MRRAGRIAEREEWATAMKRDQLNDLAAFVLVAEERSFTRAAATLGMTPSGLSHSMKTLEDRLGMQLLSRTTRSVALTEAGEKLLQTIGPPLEEIQEGLVSLSAFRKQPAGMIRVAAYKDAVYSVLWPVLPILAEQHPDIEVEVCMTPGVVDLITIGCDAGITVGRRIPKEMSSLCVSGDIRTVIVGSPAYLAQHGAPMAPKDLTEHRCINYRFPSGHLLPWEFEENGELFQMRVGGAFTFNDQDLIMAATLEGYGLAYCFEHLIAPYIEQGRLVPVLQPWCPIIPGYHLYHPNRRYVPPTLKALIDVLEVQLEQAGGKNTVIGAHPSLGHYHMMANAEAPAPAPDALH
jgi:DNA-binding transcriptional LysR family regulator